MRLRQVVIGSYVTASALALASSELLHKNLDAPRAKYAPSIPST